VFICIIGISIAITIKRINPPIIIMINGSMRDRTVDRVVSISDFIKSAAFLNIGVRLPDL